jgi:hypothetical protein
LITAVQDLARMQPIRGPEALSAAFPGLSREELAHELVTRAARSTAAAGATGAAIVAAEELLPPSWPSIPGTLAIETAAVIAIELRCVGELHRVFGRVLPEDPAARGWLLIRAWLAERDVNLDLDAGVAGLVTPALRRQITRRVLSRLGRGGTGVLPVGIGAAVAGTLNFKATRKLGERLIADLAGQDRVGRADHH